MKRLFASLFETSRHTAYPFEKYVALVIFVGIPMGFLYSRSFDLFLILSIMLVILLLCFLLYKTSGRALKKILLFSIIFLFIQCLALPLACYYMVKNNRNAFEIDDQVLKNEKSILGETLIANYQPGALMLDSILLQTMSHSSSLSLDSNLQYLNKGNIIIADSFIISNPYGYDERCVMNMLIHNTKGQLLSKIVDENFGLYHDDTIRLKSYIQVQRTAIQSKLSTYRAESNRYTEGDVWSFSNIIYYLLTFQNFKPITRSANVLVYLQNHFLQVFSLAAVLSLLVDMVIKKEEA